MAQEQMSSAGEESSTFPDKPPPTWMGVCVLKQVTLALRTLTFEQTGTHVCVYMCGMSSAPLTVERPEGKNTHIITCS